MQYLNERKKDKLFIELCEMYHEKILKYLYYTTGDIEEAKDLTQEVFTVVYKKIEILEKHNNQGGFIFQTAKNMAANFKRKKIKKLMKEAPLEKDFCGCFADIYEEIYSMHDDAIEEDNYVGEVLNCISKDKQQLYKWHYIEGKTYKEIAKILCVSETSIRMRYVRLRREIETITSNLAKEKFG